MLAKDDDIAVSRPTRRLDYGYFSPQWLYFLDELQVVVRWGLYLCLLSGWSYVLVWRNLLGVSPGQMLVVFFAGLVVAGVATRIVNGFLVCYRGGYGLRPRGSNRLAGEFVRGSIRLYVGGQPRVFAASLPHQFLMREHPERIDEVRAEERARTYGDGQQPDYFRRSFEIILDTPRERIRLAEVAFEDQARDMIRHLQELDAFARGSAGAGTQLRRVGDAGTTPLGMRPPLE